MHGLGADGNDFVPIAQEMDLAPVGPVRFVLPNAPVMPVSLNGGLPHARLVRHLPARSLARRAAKTMPVCASRKL
jgi:predicted esterase